MAKFKTWKEEKQFICEICGYASSSVKRRIQTVYEGKDISKYEICGDTPTRKDQTLLINRL